MSLNWDLNGMKERLGQEEYDRITDHPTEKGKWHPVTNGLIWATLTVGLGEISEKNVDKFVERIMAVQASSGLLVSNKGYIYITEQDVRNHIGLRTNVTDESAAKFNARLMRMSVEEGARRCRMQKHSAFDISANPELLDA